MRRQIQIEFYSPGKNLATLMRWADRRGAIIVRRDDDPAFLMLTAERATELLNLALKNAESVPLELALEVYETARSGPERRAYHRLPCFGERRLLPTFAEVMAADQIIHGDATPAEKRQLLAEHVRRWTPFVADELLGLYDAYTAPPSHENWSAFGAYIGQLIDHAVILRDMPWTVPRVYAYGWLDDKEAGEEE